MDNYSAYDNYIIPCQNCPNRFRDENLCCNGLPYDTCPAYLEYNDIDKPKNSINGRRKDENEYKKDDPQD